MKVLFKIIAIVKFIVFFLWEFLKANLSVVHTVLFVKNADIRSHLVDYHVQDLRFYEILWMAQLITLTPGTIAAKIDTNQKTITVHILNAVDPDRVLEVIDHNIKKRMLEVTR